MYARLFDDFLISRDTFRVYEGSRLLCTSMREGLHALCEYIDRFNRYHHGTVAFDKIMGNAAALLCIKANCQEIYSPVGSKIAVDTLDKYGVKYHLNQIVPYIQKPSSEEMCPMEALSLNRSPDELYEIVRKQH